MIHHETDRVTAFSAAKTMIELLTGADVKRGRFLVMERTVGFVTRASPLQRDVRSDEVDDIRRRQYLLNRFFGNQAHSLARFLCMFSTSQFLFENRPLFTTDDVTNASVTPTQTWMILITIDIETVIKR